MSPLTRAQDSTQLEEYLPRGTIIDDFWELTGTLLFCRYLAGEEVLNS
jgi:hypothetical protein